MRPAVCFRPFVLLTALLLASCGSTSTTAPTTTEVAPSTSVSPEPLTLTDVERAIGTPADLQARSAATAGNFTLAPTREIPVPDAAELFIEAQGIVQAYSRRMTMNYVNQNDPMSTHQARGIVRVIVFDTASNANVAVRKQGNSFEPIGTPQSEKTSFVTDDNGVRRAARWNIRVGGDLPCLHEGLAQRGRAVVWMVVRNRNCGGWVETTPESIARDLVGVVVSTNSDLDG